MEEDWQCANYFGWMVSERNRKMKENAMDVSSCDDVRECDTGITKMPVLRQSLVLIGCSLDTNGTSGFFDFDVCMWCRHRARMI